MDGSIAAIVGERLRTTRRERGVALSALAEASGVGKGSLSEIERGARNATIGTLYALAAALDVPMSALLGETVGAETSSDALTSRLLDVEHDERTTVEVYSLVLQPGLVHRSAAHGPGVREALLVTRGRVQAGRRGALVRLASGESTAWDSDSPHSYRALGASPARAVLTIHWPRR